ILSRADGEGPSTAQQGRSFGVYAPQDDTRARNTYFLGTFLLALAIGIRPQNFLVGFVPGVFATRKRRPHEILIALLIGITVVGSAFGGAIYATGSAENYLRAVREHRAYITNVDSFRSPERPPMLRLADRFFVKQYQSPALSIIASLLAILAISGSIRDRSRPMLLAALTFVPFAFFAWAMLDRFSISRFSIGYQPLFALLVADGICRAAKKYAPVVAAVLCIAFIAYTLPSLAVVRNEEAPSMRAARAIAQHVDPQRDRLYVGHTMTRFVDVVSPQLPYTRVIDDRDLPLATNKPAWLLAEITEGAENGLLFKRKRDNLWNIARRHYFEIKLAPVTATAQFVGGWSEVESNNAEEWRWMGNHSTTMLPPGGERTLLRVELAPAGEIEAQHPTVTLTLNGKVVDQFQVNPGANLRDLRVSAAAGNQLNMLEIAVDTNVSRALRILHLGWGPA
nr:DUF3992 domain-containing protein [Acidobacteriota bacterium]